jgi:hypothetical protein
MITKYNITLSDVVGIFESVADADGNAYILFAGVVRDLVDNQLYQLAAPVPVVGFTSNTFDLALEQLDPETIWTVELPAPGDDLSQAILAAVGSLTETNLWTFSRTDEPPPSVTLGLVDAEALWPEWAQTVRRQNAALAAEGLDATLNALGFTKTFDVSDLRAITHLFGQRRCGIYVLHMADGTLYVGQAVDIVKRFGQHRTRYDAITRLSFKPLRKDQTILDLHEQEAITILEQKGFQLLNVVHATITYQQTAFDEIMPPDEQMSWLTADPLVPVPDTALRMLVDPTRRLKFRQKYQLLRKRADSDAVIALLHTYVARCIPQPRRTEADYWSVSCMPATNANTWPRLACFNANTMELFTVGYAKDDPTQICGFLNLSDAELLKGYPNDEDFYRRHPEAELQASNYTAAGSDQISVWFSSLAQAIELLNDAVVVRAARAMNLNLMRKRKNFYGRNHCFDLADQLIEL